MGHKVVLLDDLSRAGAVANLAWLRVQSDPTFVRGDVRNRDLVSNLIRDHQFDAVIHLAGQVAVTKSVDDPRLDCEVNILGTLNVLDAVRLGSPQTFVLNAYTNKVYGNLANLPLRETPTAYECPMAREGVAESQPLDFYSPYGCSKGAADQYVIDYSRIYGIRSVNFRQSCIYGNRQFGAEEQGGVSWFVIAHLLEKPITVYGDGKQVRDLLYVDDLVDCYLQSISSIDQVSGATFNIGGGPNNSASIIEFLNLLGQISGRVVNFRFGDSRPGDQLFYVSDIRKAQTVLDWRPETGMRYGVERLYNWVAQNRELFAEPVASVLLSNADVSVARIRL